MYENGDYDNMIKLITKDFNMSENVVTLGCLAKHIDSKKLKFNTSKKNFYVPKGSTNKFKKLLHGELDDERFEAILSDQDIDTLSIDMSIMLEERFYKTVNFNLYHTAYLENKDFQNLIDREILSRGLGWKRDAMSSLMFVYGVWASSVFGNEGLKGTIAGIMSSEKDYSDGPNDGILILGSRVKMSGIIFGYNYVWQLNKKGEITVEDMKRVANRRKLKGEYFYNLYHIYRPKGFNDVSIKNNIRATSFQYPKYNDMTLREISQWWIENI